MTVAKLGESLSTPCAGPGPCEFPLHFDHISKFTSCHGILLSQSLVVETSSRNEPGAGEGVGTRLGWGVWRDGKVLEMMGVVVTLQCAYV